MDGSSLQADAQQDHAESAFITQIGWRSQWLVHDDTATNRLAWVAFNYYVLVTVYQESMKPVGNFPSCGSVLWIF